MGNNIIILNGTKYFKESFMGKLEGVFLDDFHIILHRKEVEVKGKACFMCGKGFLQKDLTKHHSIPKRFKSIFNVHIPFCKPCHVKFHKYIELTSTSSEAKE